MSHGAASFRTERFEIGRIAQECAGTTVAVATGMRHFQLSSMVFVLVLVFTGPPAVAGWSRALPGAAERVVAAGDRIAVVRNGSVQLLREDGTPLGHIDTDTEDKRTVRTPPRSADVDHLFDLLDVDDSERDTDWAADQLESERTLRDRRQLRRLSPTGPGTTTPPALASAQGQIWIAAQNALWKLDEHGSLTRVSSLVHPVDALAVGAANRMAMARGRQLLFLAGVDHVRHQVDSDAQIDLLAVSPDGGSLAWSSGNRVMLVSDSRALSVTTMPLPGPARSLAFCDDQLVLLAAGQLLVVGSAGKPELRASDLDADRIICAEQHGPWLATGGAGLLASSDNGRTWSSLAMPLTGRVNDVAVGQRCLWLATDRGLFCSSAQPVATEMFDPEPLSRPQPHIAPVWSSWLPQIVLQAAVRSSPGERDLQGLAYARLALGPRPRPMFVASAEVESSAPRSPRPLAPDTESHCLVVARARAITLAMAEPERARSYVNRARHAAWLPELRVRAERRVGRSESLDIPATSSSLSSPLGLDTVDDVRYEVRATWDLARLVFNSEELAAQTQALHMTEARRDIETTLSRLYFERRRLRLVDASDTLAAQQRELRVAEIEAQLDALSGGAFSACSSDRPILGDP